MKKFIISLLAIISVATLSAQTKGEMYAGGSLGIGTYSLISGNNNITAADFNIAPEFGYFAANNFKIGASISYGLESGNPLNHIIQIMPNMAYYVRVCDKFYYTPVLQFGFVCGIREDISMPGFGLGLSLGSFEFRPTPRLGVSVDLLSLSYAMLSYEDHDLDLDITTRSVNFNFGISPSVGIKYYF